MLLRGTRSCSRRPRVRLNSHTHTPSQPNQQRLACHPKHSPLVAATGSGADGPACCSRCWTPVSATPVREGNTERIHRSNTPHPRSRAEGASANPQVHSRGNRLTGLPTEESSPFRAERRSMTVSPSLEPFLPVRQPHDRRGATLRRAYIRSLCDNICLCVRLRNRGCFRGNLLCIQFIPAGRWYSDRLPKGSRVSPDSRTTATHAPTAVSGS